MHFSDSRGNLEADCGRTGRASGTAENMALHSKGASGTRSSTNEVQSWKLVSLKADR